MPGRQVGVREISCLSVKDTKIISTTAVRHYKAMWSTAQLLASAAAGLNDDWLPLTDGILARKQQSTKFMTKEEATSASIVSAGFNLVRPFLDHVVQEDYLLSIVNGQSLSIQSRVTKQQYVSKPK